MKISDIIIIGLSITLLWGCTKTEYPITGLNETQLTITASIAGDNNTKTTLQDSGTGVYWDVGDEIKVFYGQGTGCFVSTNTEEAKVADFDGYINTLIGVEGFSGGENLWGLYPYRSDATYDGTSVTTTIPDQQTGKAGSFAKNMNISLAKSSNLALTFYNICGGVRFSVTRDDIMEVVFEGRNDEDIAGKIQVAFSEGVPVIQNLTDGQKQITLTAPNSGTFESGKWYYIIAAPGSLSNGFKLTFNTASQYAVLEKTNEVTVKRSVFGSIENADEGLSFQPKETPIVFKDQIAKYACVEKFDTNDDGELSYKEAAAVTDISGLFTNYNTVTSFDELKYFTSLTDIGRGIMCGLSSLKSVTLPALVTSIPYRAFERCSALDSLTIMSAKIEKIGGKAFSGCSSLESFEFFPGLTRIDFGAFGWCEKLESIDLPSSLNSIEENAFAYCTSITSVTVPNTVTSFGEYMFDGCSSLESAVLPSGLTSIPEGTFRGCTSLRNVTVPNAVTSFGEYIFDGCSSLESAVLPSGLTSIPNGTFRGCTSLRNVTVPEGVTSIGDYAFYGCTSLRNVTVPEGVTSIGDYAFCGCTFIEQSTYTAKLELPSTVTSIGSKALNNVRNVLINTTSGFVTIQSNTLSFGTHIYVPDDKVEQYKIMTNWSAFASYIYPLSSYSDAPFGMKSVALGLSVRWATCNLGARSPEQYGVYYAWGDVKGQLWNDSFWGYSFTKVPDYELDSKGNLKLEYDAAHVNLGGTWRMPTKAECQELIDNCTSTWTSDYNDTGVAGLIFTSKKAGYTNKSIFLPAAGNGFSSRLYDAGSSGYYWSSTFYGDFFGDCAGCLAFSSDGVGTGFCSCLNGLSVRPVTE